MTEDKVDMSILSSDHESDDKLSKEPNKPNNGKGEEKTKETLTIDYQTETNQKKDRLKDKIEGKLFDNYWLTGKAIETKLQKDYKNEIKEIMNNFPVIFNQVKHDTNFIQTLEGKSLEDKKQSIITEVYLRLINNYKSQKFKLDYTMWFKKSESEIDQKTDLTDEQKKEEKEKKNNEIRKAVLKVVEKYGKQFNLPIHEDPTMIYERMMLTPTRENIQIADNFLHELYLAKGGEITNDIPNEKEFKEFKDRFLESGNLRKRIELAQQFEKRSKEDKTFAGSIYDTSESGNTEKLKKLFDKEAEDFAKQKAEKEIKEVQELQTKKQQEPKSQFKPILHQSEQGNQKGRTLDKSNSQITTIPLTEESTQEIHKDFLRLGGSGAVMLANIAINPNFMGFDEKDDQGNEKIKLEQTGDQGGRLEIDMQKELITTGKGEITLILTSPNGNKREIKTTLKDSEEIMDIEGLIYAGLEILGIGQFDEKLPSLSGEKKERTAKVIFDMFASYQGEQLSNGDLINPIDQKRESRIINVANIILGENYLGSSSGDTKKAILAGFGLLNSEGELNIDESNTGYKQFIEIRNIYDEAIIQGNTINNKADLIRHIYKIYKENNPYKDYALIKTFLDDPENADFKY